MGDQQRRAGLVPAGGMLDMVQFNSHDRPEVIRGTGRIKPPLPLCARHGRLDR